MNVGQDHLIVTLLKKIRDQVPMFSSKPVILGKLFDMCQGVMRHVVSEPVKVICLKHRINKQNGEAY